MTSGQRASHRLFHIRIAESTGNSVLAQVVTALWDQLRGPIWAKIEEHFHYAALRAASFRTPESLHRAGGERSCRAGTRCVGTWSA